MIHSGLRGAARALPLQQLTIAPRVGAISYPASSQHFCSNTSRPQQRRLSSSKASCPPGDRSDGPRPAAAAVTKAAETDSAKATPPRTASGRQHGGRATRSRKAKEEAWPAQRTARSNSWFSSLPSVPDTHSLSEKDLKLSSLFALHRPLSLTAPIPPATEQAEFDRIFESTPPSPAEVVSTIASTIETLENASSGGKQDGELRWQIIQESASNADAVRHLDGAPRAHHTRPRSIEELVAQLKPYEAPPAPSPLGRAQPKRSARNAAQQTAPAQPQRAFEITVNVRELAPETFAALTQPPSPQGGKQLRMPFGTRVKVSRVLRAMREPGRRQGTMRALSVKRQRKLKMKKHKYKKLMKRTRTLRRKLDK